MSDSLRSLSEPATGNAGREEYLNWQENVETAETLRKIFFFFLIFTWTGKLSSLLIPALMGTRHGAHFQAPYKYPHIF